MDVRDLAPALVAVADLFTAVNTQLNGDAADVRVEVKGSFQAGSFHIELIFLQDLLKQIRDIFAAENATAISNAWTILTILGFVGGSGLIDFLRKLRGRRPHRIEQIGQCAKVWITETEYTEVDDHVLSVWRSKTVRTSLQKVMAPLEREGITSFGIVRKKEVELSVESTELDSFSLNLEESQVVSDLIGRKMLFLESVVFKDGNKWRVHDGQSSFLASLEDEDFLSKINHGERFGKGDVLIVDLRQIHTLEDNILKVENRIIKVHEHRQPLQQGLFI
jgi:hypothetical protein